MRSNPPKMLQLCDHLIISFLYCSALKNIPSVGFCSPKATRSFKTPLPTADLENLKSLKYAKNSNRKSKWALNVFNDWRNGCIATSGVELCDTSILKSDLMNPKCLEPSALCQALCKFVTEMRKERLPSSKCKRNYYSYSDAPEI